MDYFAPDPKNPKKMIKQGRYPTMVALLLGPDRDVFAMHRTYLDINGNKAPVDDPKKFSGTTKVGPTTGGAIHLYPAEHVVALAEGIETSWAVHEATGLPVWATGNANNLEHIELPKEIEHVFIFADLDRSGRGLEAAQAAGEKLIGEGRQVQIHTPIGPIPADAKGIDWLDVYNTHGHQVFPNIRINGQPWSMYEKKQKRPERTLKAV
jgi:putative DNA primase/helicase